MHMHSSGQTARDDRAEHRGHEPRIESVRKVRERIPRPVAGQIRPRPPDARPRRSPSGESRWPSRTVKAQASARSASRAAYVARNTECAYNNLKVMTRVVSAIYDEELRPVGLRASQLALLCGRSGRWSRSSFGRLGATTFTDQTTLSRTVALLKKAGLVGVRVGDDRRVRVISLTQTGLERFAAAMPLWDARPGPRGRVALARGPARASRARSARRQRAA